MAAQTYREAVPRVTPTAKRDGVVTGAMIMVLLSSRSELRRYESRKGLTVHGLTPGDFEARLGKDKRFLKRALDRLHSKGLIGRTAIFPPGKPKTHIYHPKVKDSP